MFSYFNDWISSLGKFCSLTDWPRYPVRPSQGLFPLFWPELCSHKRGGCVGLAPGYIWTSGVGLSSLPRTLRPAVWEWQTCGLDSLFALRLETEQDLCSQLTFAAGSWKQHFPLQMQKS